MRKHSNLIKLWADNKDATVWTNDFYRGWTDDWYPAWLEDVEYRVILPEYKEAWQAYLDGELQVGDDGRDWIDWGTGDAPMFDSPPSDYRRKPKIQYKGCTLKPENATENLYYVVKTKNNAIGIIMRESYNSGNYVINCIEEITSGNKFCIKCSTLEATIKKLLDEECNIWAFSNKVEWVKKIAELLAEFE